MPENFSLEKHPTMTAWHNFSFDAHSLSKNDSENLELDDVLCDSGLDVACSNCSIYAAVEAKTTENLLKLSCDPFDGTLMRKALVAEVVPPPHLQNNRDRTARTRRTWGSEWGLCAWTDVSESLGKSVLDRKAKSSEGSSPRHATDKSWSFGRAGRRKSYQFLHVSDFKEYIRQYREKHTQSVLQKKQQSLTSPSKRKPVKSSVAEVTDLSTLRPKPDKTEHKENPQKSKEKGDRQHIHEPVAPDISYKDQSTPPPIMDTAGSCSKAFSVYRKGMNLSPVAKGMSPEMTFDIAASIALARKAEFKSPLTGRKYWNIKFSSGDVHFGLTPTKRNEPTVSPKGGLHLLRKTNHDKQTYSRRTSFSIIKGVKVFDLADNSQKPIGRSTVSSGGRKVALDGIGQKTGRPTSEQGVRHQATIPQENPSSLFLGYCLSQLSQPLFSSTTVPAAGDDNVQTYQIHGRQLHGDVATPRSSKSVGNNDGASGSLDPHKCAVPSPRPRSEAVRLGIKGSNVTSGVRLVTRQNTSLRIFDMRV